MTNPFDAASDLLLSQLDAVLASDDSEADDFAAEVAAWEEANRLARCGGTGRTRKY